MQPNKKHIKTIVLYLSFSAIGSTYAQFNTLIPKVAPEKEYQKFRVVETNELSNSNVNAEKKGSGVWKRLFRSEKAAFRKEVDSLKNTYPSITTYSTQYPSNRCKILSSYPLLKRQWLKHIPNSRTMSNLLLPKKSYGSLCLWRENCTLPLILESVFHPILKQERMHNGIDLRATLPTHIRCFRRGN